MRKLLVATAAGVLATSLIAVAGAQTPEVTVQASRVIETHVGTTSSGFPILDVSLGYGVSTAGIDLSSHAGALQLEKRVNDAAMAACKELGRRYPGSTPSDKLCAKSASDKAMVRVHELEAAAVK